MTQTVAAIFEGGVLRPLDKLILAEHEEVQVTVEPLAEVGIKVDSTSDADDPLLGLVAATGISDLAEHFEDYRFGKRQP